MPAKIVAPSTSTTSFNCPHCGAFAHQAWYDVYIANEPRDGVPDLDPGLPILRPGGRITSPFPFTHISNLNISFCFNCKKLAVWVHNQLLHPPSRTGDEPNEDLPDDILRDYEEARSIVDLSPRGAAALLRLCIQKLCIHLGESGKNLDEDIASLVRKGLDQRVQRALDIVRVIGNESVHPGKIDMRDNRDTANELFGLVNLIAEKMISEEKHVTELYESLPESKRKAIEERDRKTPGDD